MIWDSASSTVQIKSLTLSWAAVSVVIVLLLSLYTACHTRETELQNLINKSNRSAPKIIMIHEQLIYHHEDEQWPMDTHVSISPVYYDQSPHMVQLSNMSGIK